jgi:hypothetical protein
MPPFQEAHWQGLEVIPRTPTLARRLQIPEGSRGVIVDDVTFPADLAGFEAGDLITAVGAIATPSLDAFIDATKSVRDRKRSDVLINRQGRELSLVVSGFQGRLGVANGETAPMIKPGSRAPHAYKGPCTSCHRIGTKGQLAFDQGDLLAQTAPSIHMGQTPPHRDRGVCAECHRIIP